MKPERDDHPPRRSGDPSYHSHRFYPTDTRRPWETVPEWCRRLDSYYNAVLVANGEVETFDTAEQMVDAWSAMGKPPAYMGQVAR